jgi:lipopolysaccharide biosynthesis glycosyltransferase
MLKSIITNLKTYDHIIVYILDGHIHESSKELLKESLESSNVVINWIDIDNEELKDMKISTSFIDRFYNKEATSQFTVATYYRLLIPRLLPENIKKVIYLDCDTIVLDDIGDLWDQDIENHYLLAVPEMWTETMYVSSQFGLKLYKELNIPAQNKYFNAGVLVLNLQKWREDDIANKIINYLRQYKDYVLWLDQDGMNAILSGKWGELDPKWNVMTILYRYNSWKESSFDHETFEKLIKSPAILHFTESNKPWHHGNNHPKRELFFEYLNLTSWNHLSYR